MTYQLTVDTLMNINQQSTEYNIVWNTNRLIDERQDRRSDIIMMYRQTARQGTGGCVDMWSCRQVDRGMGEQVGRWTGRPVDGGHVYRWTGGLVNRWRGGHVDM